MRTDSIIFASSSSALKPDFVSLHLNSKRSDEAVRELHAALRSSDGVLQHEQLLSDVKARLALGPSCLDVEIALPHARTAAVNRFVCAVGRSDHGIWFDDQHATIRLVILVGVPAGVVTEYLRWLARLATALRKPSVREALFTAPTPELFSNAWSRYLGEKK